ncbi:Cupredoxin [Hysterangium stoloniferum]|nr:Cupredoxin [Hysterangium stoloniferum]
MLFATTFSLGLIALTHAVDHPVIVGGPGGVVAYNPPQVSVQIGDTVTFTFQQKNHTITQSSFANPCSPLEGGFDSGFQPVSPDNLSGPFPAATITIRNTDPVWIYCRQKTPASHCAAGMVFAINPGPGQFDAFVAAAKATANNGTVATNPAVASTDTPSATVPPVPAPSATTPSIPSDHKILVGDGGSLTYNPPNITAQVGDTITFEFRAKNHTVSQSSFSNPCRLLGATSGSPGFDSNFMPVPANSTAFPTYTITVNDTKPIWAYCRQTNPASHCGAGMVFAANPVESSPNTFEAFVALAKQLNGTSSNTTTTSGNSSSATSRNTQSTIALIAALCVGLISAL